jgi:hypothetical protein
VVEQRAVELRPDDRHVTGGADMLHDGSVAEGRPFSASADPRITPMISATASRAVPASRSSHRAEMFLQAAQHASCMVS